MLGRRIFDAGITCHYQTLSLFVYEPSLQTGHIDTPLGWSGQGFAASNNPEAKPRYRQSHERCCCP
jgi:hypothetical protein